MQIYIYRKDNEQQKCNLLKDFFNYRFEKGSEGVNTIKQNISDEMLISKLLSTLPETYKDFRTVWESTPQ